MDSRVGGGKFIWLLRVEDDGLGDAAVVGHLYRVRARSETPEGAVRVGGEGALGRAVKLVLVGFRRRAAAGHVHLGRARALTVASDVRAVALGHGKLVRLRDCDGRCGCLRVATILHGYRVVAGWTIIECMRGFRAACRPCLVINFVAIVGGAACHGHHDAARVRTVASHVIHLGITAKCQLRPHMHLRHLHRFIGEARVVRHIHAVGCVCTVVRSSWRQRCRGSSRCGNG